MNILQFLACLLMGVSASAHADEWSLDQLMRTLAQTKVGHASFVEKKSIAMLEKPVESSGELFYTAPDRLEKRTLKPRPESMVLDRGTLTVEQKGRKHVLPLQNYPEVAAFIDSIRGTLAGDKSALERTYQLNLSGDQQAWTLLLTPIDAKMKKIVEKIRIAGIGNELRSIEIKQADGDSSLMTITQLSPP
ncbi:acyltransferase [Novimethylophilus kurashikiensis]|uniref:Acyltransferase n=1 Tax=Novimethylophilus kurashikiensis TaxID=1825523 RepID=A0A2R5FHD7_9PROT|nr:LolA-related protein [Novimethylophilus kurashikiensis]GBG15783.1 acyltransferase [Novimethylophilus kurashikiensis]